MAGLENILTIHPLFVHLAIDLTLEHLLAIVYAEKK